ncbi:hypothetical protein KR215_008002 [Drosophila sulfurigaster]|nr:hypothetical protein KR215_008002 [Drosophila sulfurigaster]
MGEFKGSVNGDGMRYSQNRKFTTFDRDNDVGSGNCAVSYKSGWWHGNCFNR